MDNKIRVLAICHEDPEYILGGMGMHVRELYRVMAKRPDVEIDLLTTGIGEGVKIYNGYRKHVSDKLVCWKPRVPNNSSLLISDIQLMKTLLRLVNEGYKWDVVHAHEWNTMQIAWMVRDCLKIPLVTTMHLCISKLQEIEECKVDFKGEKESYSEETMYLRQQEAHLITSSDQTIVCSNSYAKMLKKMFMLDVIKRDLNVIYNGICKRLWNPSLGSADRAKREYDLPDRPIILFVGRIADMKGIRVILDMIEETKFNIKFCTVLCGEVNANTKEEKEAWDVTKRIKRLEKSKPNLLRWVGFKHGEDLRDLYKVASLVIMPSLHEPFGIVALEAMAMGVPVISTEVDGLGEIVIDDKGNEYAMIIPAGSFQTLLIAIDFLLSNELNRQELIELGFKRIKAFNWEKIVEQTIDVYKKVLGG